MLNIIYEGMNMATSIIAVIVAVCAYALTEKNKKEEYLIIPTIEASLIMEKIVVVMILLTIVLGIMSEGHPIMLGLNCVYLFFWAIVAREAYLSLKQLKNK